MPLLPGDDYLYHLKFPESGYIGQQVISSFTDLFESQKNHFTNYNYRITPHLLLQTICLFPPLVFDILNSLVFLLLPIVMLLPFKKNLKQDYLFVYCSLLLFIWLFHFDLGRAYFWTSGALNYSWMLIPQLYIIGRIFLLFDDKIKFKVHDLFVALLVAFSNENATLTLFMLMVFVAISRLKNNSPHDRLFYISTLIILIGGLMMLYAPSMSGRLSYQGFKYSGVPERLAEFGRRQIYYIIRYQPALLLLLLFKRKHFHFKSSMLFLLGIFISSASMFFAPLYEPRSALFGFMLSIMFALSIIKKYQFFRLWPLILMICSSLFVIFERLPLFEKLQTSAKANLEILQKERGSTDTVYLNKYCDASKFSCLVCDEISDDPAYIDNEPLAAFYNIHKIALKPNFQ